MVIPSRARNPVFWNVPEQNRFLVAPVDTAWTPRNDSNEGIGHVNEISWAVCRHPCQSANGNRPCTSCPALRRRKGSRWLGFQGFGLRSSGGCGSDPASKRRIGGWIGLAAREARSGKSIRRRRSPSTTSALFSPSSRFSSAGCDGVKSLQLRPGCSCYLSSSRLPVELPRPASAWAGKRVTAVIPVLVLLGFVFANIPMLDSHPHDHYGAAFDPYAQRTKKPIPFRY